MRYGARRLNRSHLRPRLLAHKQKYDQAAHTGEENVLPGETSSESSVTILSPEERHEDVQGANRLKRFIRPSILRASTPTVGDAILEGDWEQAKREQAKPIVHSSAARWAAILLFLIFVVWGAAFLIGFQTSLAILLAVGLVLTVVGLVSPSLGLLAIGMVSALDAMANIYLLTGGLLRYNTLNYFLLLVILINIPFILRLSDLSSRTLQILLLLMTLMLTMSENVSNGVQDILNIGATFGIIVYFARALKDDQSIYWLGVVNGILTGLGGLVFILQMSSLPYANPNDWTYFPLTGLFSICISYPYAVRNHKNRVILLLLAAINFVWIFLSASRGSLLIAIIAAAFLFLSTRSITWKTILVVIIVGVGVWVSASFAEQQLYTVTRIQELFDPSLSPTQRTSKRSAIADIGLQLFEQNPMGIGTGSFETESAKTGLLGRNRPPHSAWIQVLAENGVLGILFLTFFICSYALVGINKRSEGKLLFALFITITLASAFIAKEFRGKSLWFLAASGIILLQPRVILAYLNKEAARSSTIGPQKIRSVRFGRKR